MDLANCVTLYLFLICLSLCSGYGVLIDSKDGADKQNEMQAHVKTVRTPALVRDGGGGSSGGYSSGDDYDDDPPTVCAGGLGYYQDVGPSSCCCQPCGPGAGPVKLPDRDALDPDEDSCCPIDTTVEAEAHWGCCNCPDGLWILRWNSSEDPKMDYKQPNHLERESVHKLVKLAHKIFRINHEKQGNKPKEMSQRPSYLRVLIDHTYVEQPNSERTHRVAMTGGQGGGGGGGYGRSGSGSGLGDPNCGDGQPWYPPPVSGGGCGCGGCSCGGGGSPPGGGSCAPVPQPITCPVGCQPAFGEPNMVYWAYKWPTHHMSNHGPSFESNKHMYGAEAQTTIDEDKQGRKPNEKVRPNEKEKQDSEPMSPNEEEKNNGGPKPNEKVKQNVEVWPNEKEKQDSEPMSVDPFGKGD
ncbi:hypothetical protein Pfo_014139 [Paulownia fortunei]|nr:hypothetical protein Pfo_014139 [Paulownia fortunei]